MFAAVAPERSAVEEDIPGQAPIITTLYDLIAALNDVSAPGEEDLVTAAVVRLCQAGYLRFLALPHAPVIVDACKCDLSHPSRAVDTRIQCG
jgi:hypothetical protein